MSNLKYYLKSPFLISALACAFFLYAFTLPSMSGKRPEIPASMDCLKSISGSVSLNPSKSGSGKTYSTEIALSSVGMVSGGAEFRSEASGKIKVMIPSSIVEAVYPGKLHSVSSSAVLIENGEKISCTGVWSDSIGAFMAESVTYEGYDDSFWGVISHFRAVCRLMFKRLMFSWGHAGGLLLSLLSGAREYLEDGLGDSFRHAGLSHVLALSGMHLSFFSSMAGGVGKTISKRIMPFFQLSGILFFVWFAGMSPSLFRALVCSLISLTARCLMCRKVDTLEVLACTFLIHAAFKPQDLSSVAFMLSYAALAGILVFSGLINRLMAPVFPPMLSGSLSASFGAQLATCPISLAFFGSFAPVGIVSTVFISPMIGLFISVSMIFMASSFAFPFLSGAFGSIMNLFYDGMACIVRFFAGFPPIQIT